MSKYCYDMCLYKIITTKEPFSSSFNIKAEHKDSVNFKGLDQCHLCWQGALMSWGGLSMGGGVLRDEKQSATSVAS